MFTNIHQGLWSVLKSVGEGGPVINRQIIISFLLKFVNYYLWPLNRGGGVAIISTPSQWCRLVLRLFVFINLLLAQYFYPSCNLTCWFEKSHFSLYPYLVTSINIIHSHLGIMCNPALMGFCKWCQHYTVYCWLLPFWVAS